MRFIAEIETTIEVRFVPRDDVFYGRIPVITTRRIYCDQDIADTLAYVRENHPLRPNEEFTYLNQVTPEEMTYSQNDSEDDVTLFIPMKTSMGHFTVEIQGSMFPQDWGDMMAEGHIERLKDAYYEGVERDYGDEQF